ncbi:hypothetical protein JZ751_009580 [Albula glossodonta]|uniref:Uncharacterized protein n=1 Tax=Albula glossodonta TaxID=121402 RepID=A0A8T2NY49_9TELE|nr:hypothetical protein JZ751_009580 [Albula glossodonta]
MKLHLHTHTSTIIYAHLHIHVHISLHTYIHISRNTCKLTHRLAHTHYCSYSTAHITLSR